MIMQREDRLGEVIMPFGNQNNRDDRLLAALQDMFADQNKQLNAQGQQLAQQTQRMDAVSNQIQALANQQEALRNDFNQRWQDLPKLYVPRQEHQAMGLDARTVALEEFRVAATKDIADIKLNTAREISNAQLTSKTEISNAKEGFSNFQIGLFVTIFGIGIPVVTEIILKIIFH